MSLRAPPNEIRVVAADGSRHMKNVFRYLAMFVGSIWLSGWAAFLLRDVYRLATNDNYRRTVFESQPSIASLLGVISSIAIGCVLLWLGMRNRRQGILAVRTRTQA